MAEMSPSHMRLDFALTTDGDPGREETSCPTSLGTKVEPGDQNSGLPIPAFASEHSLPEKNL